MNRVTLVPTFPEPGVKLTLSQAPPAQPPPAAIMGSENFAVSVNNRIIVSNNIFTFLYISVYYLLAASYNSRVAFRLSPGIYHYSTIHLLLYYRYENTFFENIRQHLPG
jgi:hypothetical protein